MAAHETHKATAQARRETMRRREVRKLKANGWVA